MNTPLAIKDSQNSRNVYEEVDAAQLNRNTHHWNNPALTLNPPPPGQFMTGLRDDAGCS
jgi:hypothetical protein